MRRFIAITTLLFAAAALAGCGDKPKVHVSDDDPAEVADNDTDPNPRPTRPVAPAPQPVLDGIAQTPPPMSGTTIPPFAVYPQPKSGPPVAPAPMIDPSSPLPKLPSPPSTPEPKEPPKPKETVSGSVKEVEWPTQIYGRSLADYVGDINDPDPSVRERALRMLPGFGPVVKQNEAAAKGILTHMDRGREFDPGVRAAAYEAAGHIGFEKDLDTKEAVRLLWTAADMGSFDGGPGRLHAVKTIATFGPKAAAAIPRLVEAPSKDRAYETRMAVANALGRIAFDDVQGPDKKAIACLVRLASDHSAPVRLEAVQSLLLLGPPYQPRPKAAPPLMDLKVPPPLDTAAVADYVADLKKQLLPAKKVNAKEKPSLTGLVERDPQVEIYLRLAIMRLDMKEMTSEEHLDRIAMYIAGDETGPKLQALSAISMMGEYGAKRIDDVVKVLNHEDPLVVNTAVTALVAMGTKGEPAISAIQKLKDRKPMAADPKEQDEEKKYWVKLAEDAVKAIQEAGKKEMAPAPVAGP